MGVRVDCELLQRGSVPKILSFWFDSARRELGVTYRYMRVPQCATLAQSLHKDSGGRGPGRT